MALQSNPQVSGFAAWPNDPPIPQISAARLHTKTGGVLASKLATAIITEDWSAATRSGFERPDARGHRWSVPQLDDACQFDA
jgi:hypothetical protein